MRAGEVIDRVVADGVRKAVPRGEWKRTGRHFVRAVNDLSHVVEVQASRRNVGARGQFTINVAVASVAVGRLWRDPEASDNPAAWQHRLVDQRIGFLMPVARDHWWPIDEQTDVEALGRDVETTLRECVPRFFGHAGFQSCTALLGDLADARPISGFLVPVSELHAVLLCHLGRRGEGLAMLRADLDEMRAKNVAEGVRRGYLNGAITRVEALVHRIESG
jgi:hypothetical protein